ncbi:hypothetical protein K3495_g2474 [Podosphaera aphanis]|nr:hypothetical protein K3495_g2474 [Podosphaera aphanis]
MNRQFETLDLSQDTAIKFDNLQQGNRSFQNFLATFVALAAKCKKTEEQKVNALKKKVSSDIATAIKTLAQPPRRDNFDAWADQCQIFYNNQQEFNHNQKTKKSSYFSSTMPSPQEVPSMPTENSETFGDPMQLDAMKADERQKCFDEGRCYYCKELGHIVKECGNKKLADLCSASRARGQGSRGNLFRRGGFSQSLPRGRGNGPYKARIIEDHKYTEEEIQPPFSTHAENRERSSGKE